MSRSAILEQLRELKLTGMLSAYKEIMGRTGGALWTRRSWNCSRPRWPSDRCAPSVISLARLDFP